jgi:hypothetical protein
VTGAGVLNSTHPEELRGVNAYPFEAVGRGAAVLCEFRQELAELFDVEQKLFVSGDFDQLLERRRDCSTSLTSPLGSVTPPHAILVAKTHTIIAYPPY